MKQRATSSQPKKIQKPLRSITEDLLESIDGNYESASRRSYDVSEGLAEEYVSGSDKSGDPCRKPIARSIPVDISRLTIMRAQKHMKRKEHKLVIKAKVTLTQLGAALRQFVAQTGSGHHLILDDPTGGTGPKPIGLVAVALAGCTAFDVITYLRLKRHQQVTGYEVRVEADQAQKPPQMFTTIRIHRVVTGHEIDSTIVEEAVELSEAKYCSVGAMLRRSADIIATYEILPEKTAAAAAAA